MNLRTLFERSPLVAADGAMGTYFSEKTGLDTRLCETYNTIDPSLIRQIHQEYIAAGARLLRTNTFSANRYTLGVSDEALRDILTGGFRVAAECAGEEAVVCANVSVLYDNTLSREEMLHEYALMIDTFLDCGAGTFIFETLPDLRTVLPAIDYLHSRKPEAEIIASFALLPDGHTRSGTSVGQLLQEITAVQERLTMVGLNCGCGALQLLPKAAPFFSYIRKNTKLYTCAMPNAGYPTVENRRTIFKATPEYFAAQTARLLPLGLNAVGGCCGTAPTFIRLLNRCIRQTHPSLPLPSAPFHAVRPKAPPSSCLSQDDFIIAAELDPPDNADMSRLISAAQELKKSGVSVITVSDSPLGHARMDSVICSAVIRREAGIEALPHICCRDRNLNALRSLLLGAHAEGIRAVLAVTGDTIAESDRGVVKPVFNVDSTRLMELIGKLNEDLFADAPFTIGGAFDPSPRKQPFSLSRLAKKQKNGASFVLTQPVFSEECLSSIDAARAQGVKVLVGLMPLVSFRNASFMKNEVPGIYIPDPLVRRFDPSMTREEAAAVGIDITVDLARRFRAHADGFYFMTPFNRANIITRIIRTLEEGT